jgi:hypothetical protein
MNIKKNYGRMTFEYQIRFYFGTVSEADFVGRKAFSQHNSLKVNRVIDRFEGSTPEDFE